MKKTVDLIGIGDPILDLAVEMEKLPETNTNAKLYGCCFQGGGNVPTALAAAGRLGLKCAILGIMGDDMAGNANIADFRFNHVDASHLTVDLHHGAVQQRQGASQLCRKLPSVRRFRPG